MNSSLWVEKYRPTKLEDLVVNDEIKNMLRNYLNKNTIPNLLLFGTQGIGKTTLAKILVNELQCDFLYINASVDNNVDVMRTTVKTFCNAMSSTDCDIKIVILDEADALTSSGGNGSSAQAALRNIIEEASDNTRFILTANYLNKIIEPLQSRCTPLKISTTEEDIVKRLLYILKCEKVKIKSKLIFQDFINNVVKRFSPDIRSIVNNLEHCSVTGIFCNTGTILKEKNNEIIDYIINEKKPREIRKFLIENETEFSSDYINLAGQLFNNIDNPEKQIMIAEHIYRMNLVLDKEIEFSAMILELKKG